MEREGAATNARLAERNSAHPLDMWNRLDPSPAAVTVIESRRNMSDFGWIRPALGRGTRYLGGLELAQQTCMLSA